MRDQLAHTPEGGQEVVSLDGWPDKCPLCHSAIAPIGLDYCYATEEWTEKTFRCPNRKCQHLFIAHFGRMWQAAPIGTASFYALEYCAPSNVAAEGFSKTIGDDSSTFVAIHQQAEIAEARGLNLVCGPGYRKALEFLVKDYVAKKHPAEQEEIKHLPLAECIRKYVRNDKISAVAERAAWLGNDEVHYSRRWEDKDLQHLKALIQLTVRWIEMEEMTEQAVKDMPAKKQTNCKATS